MDFIESLFYMIWRGIAIGILISAPMGPVGILCIQRTLDKGRLTGLYTGVGAALSDLFYCLLTGFGLSFIEDFIEHNQNVIQLIGSAVLIGFGIYLFRKKPAPASLPGLDITENRSPKKNILAGFLFTFSNPLILFLIIGLFARFNFLVPEMKFYHYIVGFIGITAGALGWWWFVTFVIDKVRSRFTMHSMMIANKIIGIVIMIFAVVGIVTGISSIANATYWNKARGYAPFRHATPDGILLSNTSSSLLIDTISLAELNDDTGPIPLTSFRLSFRADNRHGHPSRRYTYTTPDGHGHSRKLPPWAITLSRADGSTTWITVSKTEGDDDIISSATGTVVEISEDNPVAAAPVVPAKYIFPENTLPFSGETLWTLEQSPGKLRIIAGARSPHEIAEIPIGNCGISAFGFAVSPGGEILLSDIALSAEETITIDATPLYDDTSLRRMLAEEDDDDPLTGYWDIFDRNLDESLLRLGGDYKLAVVKNHDRYEIIYLAGARINSSFWKPGMLKGVLIPTSFPDLYNLEWYDAEGKKLYNSVTAQPAYNGTLTIQFPYQSSTLRLRKVK